MRVGRRAAAPQVVQILERRQIVYLALHPQALRTRPAERMRTHQDLTRAQWNGFVELLPMWMAPNLVTLLGFFFIIGNVGLLELYIPDLVGPVGAIYARGWNSS
jgi:hypothetical protein